MAEATSRRAAWTWVPSLYFAEGLPYVVVMVVSVIMYKRLGISNTEIALYTSWLYLPWVIKPFWSPLVDTLRTKRGWIVAMQLLIGGGLAGVALTIPMPGFLQYSLAFLWLLAFSSATHDIAADGFYMLGLSEHDQAWFVGIRSTFYRAAMITGQGLLVILAGSIESATGLPTVEVPVAVRQEAPVTRVVPPDSVRFDRDTSTQRLLVYPDRLELAPVTQAPGDVDSLVAFARSWNRDQGFYPAESPAAATSQAPEEASLWSRYVAAPLERRLRAFAAPEAAAEDGPQRAGNVGVVYFSLAQPVPDGEQVVVNFGLEDGDASIHLAEGDRFTFDAANWDQPFMAVVRLDPKLEGATSAGFVARSGNIPFAWSITFYVLAGSFLLLFFYHRFILPRPPSDGPSGSSRNVVADFVETFVSFFQKPQIGVAIAFLLLYRFAEAQLVKLATPFMLDGREVGGLALTTGEVGVVYGTVGVLALTVGGILGGIAASRDGLKAWLWPMVVAINLPNAVYIFLAYAQPEAFWVINVCVAIEQFGYGFGFAAYLLYMIFLADGPHKTAHYALCTGFMALGMMIPGLFSGWLQEIIGYQHFFLWILFATVPAFVAAAFLRIDPAFGKKSEVPA